MQSNEERTKKYSLTHRHEPEYRLEIQIQEVRNEYKRKASDDIHERPRKIIRKEMSSIENYTIIEAMT